MDVQHKEEGPGRHALTVTVEADVVTRTYDAAHRQVAQEVRLAGFRPGHAPLALVARTHAAAIGDQVRQHLVERTLPQALGESKLSPVSRPSVVAGEVRRGALFTYTAHIEVLPPVVVSRIEGLEVTVPDETVSDAAVEAELERERQASAEMRPVEGRSRVEAGDAVVADIDTFGADRRPIPSLQARQLLLDTRDTQLLDGLVEGLVGAEVPGEVRVKVTLPAQYQPAHLAGSRVEMQLRLHELKERFVPPLDDALAQDGGHADVAAWREAARARLGEAAAERAQEAREGAVIKALVAHNPIEVPPGLVELEVEQTMDTLLRDRQMSAKGLPAALRDELRKNLTAPSRDRLAAGLLVEQVSRERAITVDEAALDADIDRRVAAAGGEAQKVRASFTDPQRRERLREHLTHQKVVAYLLEHAQVAQEAAPAEVLPAPAAG